MGIFLGMNVFWIVVFIVVFIFGCRGFIFIIVFSRFSVWFSFGYILV